jgi:hypothetical protein
MVSRLEASGIEYEIVKSPVYEPSHVDNFDGKPKGSAI